jgi:hypothetical protein
MKKLLASLAALLVVPLSACSPGSTPPGPYAAYGTVGQVGYVYYRWKEGLALMIWHDIAGSSMSSGSGSTTDPVYRLHGYAESQDGRRLDWELQTSDGMTAQFEIDNTSYDLLDGALFIITTQGGETDVRQLERDLSDVQTNHESCLAFARSDPDLVKFIGDTPVPQ